MAAKDPLVGIVVGSDSDLDVMKGAAEILKDFDVACEMVITSAHRTPEKTAEYANSAAGRGIRVVIAGAGYAAHLAGVIASQTILPVIGVPINSSSLAGLDSLLATVQMPAGVPVATVTIGKAGAKNAALLAVGILALTDEGLADKLREYRKKLAEKVAEKDRKLR